MLVRTMIIYLTRSNVSATMRAWNLITRQSAYHCSPFCNCKTPAQLAASWHGNLLPLRRRPASMKCQMLHGSMVVGGGHSKSRGLVLIPCRGAPWVRSLSSLKLGTSAEKLSILNGLRRTGRQVIIGMTTQRQNEPRPQRRCSTKTALNVLSGFNTFLASVLKSISRGAICFS